MSELLSAGQYEGKVVTYGASKTREGKPQIKVMFAVTFEGKNYSLVWAGQFNTEVKNTTSARQMTLDALATLGFNGDWAALGAGRPGALNASKTFDVQVTQFDYNGKQYNKISSVNSNTIRDQLDQGTWMGMVKQMGIEGDWHRRKAANGHAVTQSANGGYQPPAPPPGSNAQLHNQPPQSRDQWYANNQMPPEMSDIPF